MQTTLSDDPRATTPEFLRDSPIHHEITSRMLLTTSARTLPLRYLCITCTYCPRIRRWRSKKADTRHLTGPRSIRGVQWFTAVNYFTGVILFEASSVLPSRQTGVRGQQIKGCTVIRLYSRDTGWSQKIRYTYAWESNSV